MTRPTIEQMRLVVTIDSRIAKAKEGLAVLGESFGKSVNAEDVSALRLEELNAGLDKITEGTAELIIMLTPVVTQADTQGSTETTVIRRKRGHKYELEGEWLTFSEIMQKHPHLNENTLRGRLNPNSSYTVHEAVYGRASAPAAAGTNGSAPPQSD